MSRFKDYFSMTKPGIIYGNWMTAAAGFLLAARGQVDLGMLVAMLAGIGLVIGSGCVFNNYMDRGIDAKMARTKKRVLVTGAISGRAALAYGTVLGLVGFGILAAWTTVLTAGVAAVGWVVYVIIYGYTKRRSVHGTLVGSVAGAVPLVVGYTAVTGQLDTGAWILFVILALWQIPHFYAIAIYRRDDYAAAGLPVLPVKLGVPIAKVQILFYIVMFMAAVAMLTTFGYAGDGYLVVMMVVSAWWLGLGIRGLRAGVDDAAWARKMFGFSLVVLMVFSLMISMTVWLP